MSTLQATLARQEWLPDGTFGLLYWNGQASPVFTVEREWRENRLNESCIPPGEYICIPRQYYAGNYPATEVTGVPGRSNILFHRANWPWELNGCIAIGTYPAYHPENSRRGVLHSLLAWQRFAQAGFIGSEWVLTIT